MKLLITISLAKMTYKEIKCGQRLFNGRIQDNINWGKSSILKTSNGQFFRRTDSSELPRMDRNPYVEMFQVEDKTVVLFLTNNSYSVVEPTKVVESKIKGGFKGCAKGMTYQLENGQTWKQIDRTSKKLEKSSQGHVLIFNESEMLIDQTEACPKVKLIK